MKTRDDDWTSIFNEHRSALMAFSFRMTGSLADAEDLVQETSLECAKTDLSKIVNPKAWMMKVCSNKGIDFLKSARRRRESYIGVWLPDHLPRGLHPWSSMVESSSAEETVLFAESLTTAFLLLLEKLSPQERVIFLPSDVLGYSFHEISEMLKKKADACRKTAERARASIQKGQTKFSHPSRDDERILREFFSHAKDGNIQKMIQLLGQESELFGDGGGKVKAAGYLTHLPDILEFFKGLILSGIFQSDGFKLEIHQVNHRPGVIISRKLSSGLWTFDTIMSFEFQNNRIVRIYAQRNPAKLAELLREN